MFSSVLIANRGEIACRIARSARKLGLRVIAVYSEADRHALHVRAADEAHCIGPAPAGESYLRAERIIEAARQSGAECIHPGYGFLSENPAFAEACAGAGIAFVGPSPRAIRAMGLKHAAKDLMRRAGVPVVPGYQGDSQEPEFLADMARETGYPIMIKAVAGGGGKGMRRVDAPGDFAEALAACRREARSAFADERVLVEKFIAEPRHVEIQILGDMHGNVIHLHERDCSLQRRHQKVIEEAPAPGLEAELRQAMGAAAAVGARAVAYVGAGTMEFILDKDGDFHFMEMNTRLQVEHPVTEMITGLDLVELQFRIAGGEALPLRQSNIAMHGHAIEARLYAESPESGFLPQTGTLHRLRWPEPSPHLRIETGVEEGNVISAHYDPLIAKLIAWGETRDVACALLSEAICSTTILGLRTNKRFLNRILQDEDFAEARLSTGFIADRLERLVEPPDLATAYASAATSWIEHDRNRERDVWSDASGWSLSGLPRRDRLDLDINSEPAVVWVDHAMHGIRIERSGKVFDTSRLPASAGTTMEDSRPYAYDPGSQILFASFEGYQIAVRRRQWEVDDLGQGQAATRSPMPGKVLRVLARVGDEVRRGQVLILLEAMKMEHALKAGIDGHVASLAVHEGVQVKEGDLLCVLIPSGGT